MTDKRRKTPQQRKRLPHEIKPTHKGHKSLKGQGELYETPKKSATFSITPLAINYLEQAAISLGISKSETIERMCRRLLNGENGTMTEILQIIESDQL